MMSLNSLQTSMPNKNKSEIEGRLRKLSLVDNIITLNEAKEKLDVLSKNADILKETQLMKYESRTNKSLNNSALSTQRIKALETQLGLSIDESYRNVTTLKDPLKETKSTFLKNQKQAEEFVIKLRKDK